MKIELHKIPIREVVAGYKDSAEEGVVAYGGKLDIRPKYQREFVYEEKQRNAVIETIKNSFPLNVMYWMIREDLPAPRPGEFCVYVLKCADGSFYIGQTDNYERRLNEHAEGKGAEWTKNHLPFEPIHWEVFNTREDAVKREKDLKTGFGRKWLKSEYEKGALARQAGGGYEMLDGQQRTISIGQYVNGDFSIQIDGKPYYFSNLLPEQKNQILDYELMIYFCEGTDKERLDWFRVINTFGEKVNEQEIRNAVYTGPWLSDAKLKFSKTNCVAYRLANDGGQLVSGTPIRQEYLETALSWINDGKIENYMARHQHEDNADELWQYFQDVIAWVRNTFTKYRKEMKDIAWGKFYNENKDRKFDSMKLEKEIAKLMEDDDITNRKGIYAYILTREEKHLNLRAFSLNQKRQAYERQKGICTVCKKHFKIEEMEADHITPWHEGGKTIPENCRMLCKRDNRTKSGK